MRLGLIAIASETGLGYQTRDYYKHLDPHKTILIDISNLNGTKQHYEWYENAHLIKGIPDEAQIRSLLQDIDVLLTAETVYNLELYRIAREMGVKTVCVENPEFYDHIKYPQYEMPDLIILPSVWLQKEITHHAKSRGCKTVQIHHPVDRTQFPFRLRRTNKPIHIAGKPATNDRNGTWDYLRQLPDGTVITQSNDMAHNIRRRYRNARCIQNIENPQQLYEYGDFLVFPRRYGGNCLPLNEALSSGMPVLMPDISPNNYMLPKEWLVPASVVDTITPRTDIAVYSCDPDSLRDKIEWFKNCDMAVESEKANKIADTISWTTLKPQYERVLNALYEGTL